MTTMRLRRSRNSAATSSLRRQPLLLLLLLLGLGVVSSSAAAGASTAPAGRVKASTARAVGRRREERSASAFVGQCPLPPAAAPPAPGAALPLLGRRGGGGQNKGIAGMIFKTIGGLFKKVFSSLLPLGMGGAKSFTEAFEAEFGARHPAFIEAPTLSQALAQARTACKFLVVYLPSASPRDEKRHKAFCRTLTDPDVIKTMKPSFLFWAPLAGTPGHKGAAKELLAKRQPYLAVVHMNVKPPRRTTVKSLHHFKPPPAPEQALVWLNRTLEIHGHVLEDDKKEREFFVKEAKLQVEQREEYNKALLADRDREETEKRERAERLAQEAAAKKKAAEDAARREKKKAALGPEPQGDGDDVCRIAVRLPGGAKAQRAFAASDSLERVFDWADVEGVDLEAAKLVQTRPKRAFTYPEDKAQTLSDAGLKGQVLLLVESR